MRLGFGTFQVVYTLLKATMFGAAIAFVCSYEGYVTEAGAEGVGPVDGARRSSSRR